MAKDPNLYYRLIKHMETELNRNMVRIQDAKKIWKRFPQMEFIHTNRGKLAGNKNTLKKYVGLHKIVVKQTISNYSIDLAHDFETKQNTLSTTNTLSYDQWKNQLRQVIWEEEKAEYKAAKKYISSFHREIGGLSHLNSLKYCDTKKDQFELTSNIIPQNKHLEEKEGGEEEVTVSNLASSEAIAKSPDQGGKEKEKEAKVDLHTRSEAAISKPVETPNHEKTVVESKPRGRPKIVRKEIIQPDSHLPTVESKMRTKVETKIERAKIDNTKEKINIVGSQTKEANDLHVPEQTNPKPVTLLKARANKAAENNSQINDRNIDQNQDRKKGYIKKKPIGSPTYA